MINISLNISYLIISLYKYGYYIFYKMIQDFSKPYNERCKTPVLITVNTTKHILKRKNAFHPNYTNTEMLDILNYKFKISINL